MRSGSFWKSSETEAGWRGPAAHFLLLHWWEGEGPSSCCKCIQTCIRDRQYTVDIQFAFRCRSERELDVNTEPHPGLAGQRARQAGTQLCPAKGKHQQMTNKHRLTHPRVGVHSCQKPYGATLSFRSPHQKPPRQGSIQNQASQHFSLLLLLSLP